ncbi:MAG: yfgC 1 [Acidobacteriales bacterium]|nr:yfgC 1 [Terriglobales bacterium]
MFRQSLRRKSCVAAIGLFLAACAGKQQAPLRPGENAFPEPHGFNQYTPEQEVQLGRQVAAEADAQLPELPTRGPIQDYVSTLGQKLAHQLPQNPYDFNFKVVNEKDINAFALPGGPVRINLGTIQAADNEAQLAGVIAHEISHVYMRHATRNASKESIAQLPAAILGGILGNGAGGQLARLGLSAGLGSVFLKYSRDAESEADRTGAKIMYEAGYDPRAMAQFFDKLKQEDRAGGPQFLSDHPDPGNRAEAVTQAISELPAKRFLTDSPEFRRAKQVAATMKPYTAEQVAQMQQQRQPRVTPASQGSISPSGGFQTLNHSAFQMDYPANWQVFGNANSAVTIAPQGGVSNDSIAYGVIVNLYRPQTQISLSQSTQQIYQALRNSNQSMRAISAPQQIQVSGLPGEIVNLQSPSPLADNSGQPIAERDMLVTVQRQDGSILWLLFIAPEQQFDALSPTFKRMLDSLQTR